MQAVTGPWILTGLAPNRISSLSCEMRQKSLKFFRPRMPLFQHEQKFQFDFQFFGETPLIVFWAGWQNYLYQLMTLSVSEQSIKEEEEHCENIVARQFSKV